MPISVIEKKWEKNYEIQDYLAVIAMLNHQHHSGGILHRSFIIVQGGRDIEFVSTDPTLVIAGSMKKR